MHFGWHSSVHPNVPLLPIYIIMPNQDERKETMTKRTSNPSAFELIVFQVLPEVLCAQSPAYHELAL
jgi:hypothetical protein